MWSVPAFSAIIVFNCLSLLHEKIAYTFILLSIRIQKVELRFLVPRLVYNKIFDLCNAKICKHAESSVWHEL